MTTSTVDPTLLALTSMTAACAPCEERAAASLAASDRKRRREYGETAATPAPAAPPSGQSQGWSGVIGVEGELTGDGRLIDVGALRWESLPIPLRYVSSDVGAHDGAVVVGRVNTLVRTENGQIVGEGDFDLSSLAGVEAARQVGEGLTNGVSMDLDDVNFEVRVASELVDEGFGLPMFLRMDGDPFEQGEEAPPREVDADGRVKVAEINSDDEVQVTTSGRIRAATIVAIPAFSAAKIQLVGSQDALAAASPPPTVEEDEATPPEVADAEDAAPADANAEFEAGVQDLRDIQDLEFASPEYMKLSESARDHFQAAVDGLPADDPAVPEIQVLIDKLTAFLEVDWEPEPLPGETKAPPVQVIAASAFADEPVSDKAWGGFSESDYDDDQWFDATVLHTNGDSRAKADNKLPIREPDGTLNRNGVHAAAGRFNQAEAPAEAKAAAAAKLRGAYATLGEDPPPVLAEAADTLVASAVRELRRPPARWFADPHFGEATPLSVSEDGRISGHLATWGTCHTGHAHQCIQPPVSGSGYRYFHTGSLLTAEGTEVAVGHITMDARHATASQTAAATLAHYEHTGRAVADVVAGEDAYGIWVAGALRPSVTEEQKRALRASPLSGDWRRIGTSLELVAALAVNVPGFPIPRPSGLVAGGALQSLVASGMLAPRRVRRPGTDGALTSDDLRYLKRLASRERAQESTALRDRVNAAKVRSFAARRRLTSV
jgi:hypothetical protein